MEEIQNNWKPKRWLATLLSLLFTPTGLLYLGQLRLSVYYFIVSLVIGVLVFLLFNQRDAIYWIAYPTQIICAIHTYRIASTFKADKQRPWYSRWWGIPTFLISFLLLPIFIFRSFFFEPFHIPSASMSPSYNPGDYIIISKLGYGNYGTYGLNFMHTIPRKAVHRGDAVVFSFPPNPKIDYIMRAIGLPNDKISYKNNKLYVNDHLLEIPSTAQRKSLEFHGSTIDGVMIKEQSDENSWYIFKENLNAEDFEIIVPADQYFVMGDNRNNSRDSRYWGSLPSENIKGKVIYSTGSK